MVATHRQLWSAIARDDPRMSKAGWNPDGAAARGGKYHVARGGGLADRQRTIRERHVIKFGDLPITLPGCDTEQPPMQVLAFLRLGIFNGTFTSDHCRNCERLGRCTGTGSEISLAHSLQRLGRQTCDGELGRRSRAEADQQLVPCRRLDRGNPLGPAERSAAVERQDEGDAEGIVIMFGDDRAGKFARRDAEERGLSPQRHGLGPCIPAVEQRWIANPEIVAPEAMDKCLLQWPRRTEFLRCAVLLRGSEQVIEACAISEWRSAAGRWFKTRQCPNQ